MRISILVLIAILALVAAKSGDKCYALALEGGGDKGAYQAGALAQIVEDSDPSEVQYDVITGVSIGSINGALLAGYPKGQEKNATEYMAETWKTLTRRDIYKNWPWGGVARGLLFKGALYDSSPFREYIRGQISPPQRSIIVSATDARTGAMKTWDENDDFETLLRGIDASSSYPGFFEPVEDLDNTTYYDGGTSFSVNIFGAINRCVEMGYDYTDIVVDTILCSGATFKDKDVSKYSTIPMVLRFLEIERYYDTMELITRAQQDFKGVNFRYSIVPTEKLEVNPVPMSFNHNQILKMLERGREDAKKALSLGEGVSTKMLIDYHQKKLYEPEFVEDYKDFLIKQSSA